MIAIASLLLVVSLSLLVTRAAAVALSHTGLSQETARFQARSAFTGVGFTTTEAETVVNHPVRRRIVMTLMLLGNAGIVTGVAALILSFVNQGQESSAWLRIGAIGAGMALILGITRIPWVDRLIGRGIDWQLKKWTDFDARDYAQLLCLTGDYGVSEMVVNPEDWLARKTLAEARLEREGMRVLGIHRAGGDYLGTPTSSARIEPRDRLILYGRSSQLAELDCRCRGEEGDRQHHEASEEHAASVAESSS